jgi:hypothetical protein
MLELKELLVFLIIDDESIAKWCATTDMPEEQLKKCKTLLDWIAKETKKNRGRFLRGATAENESMSFLQIAESDAKNAAMNKLRQQKSVSGNKRSLADREDVFAPIHIVKLGSR